MKPTLTVEGDGSESRELAPRASDGGSAFFTFHSRHDRPVLAFLEDLEPAGGAGVRNDDGQPEPVWICPGHQGGAFGTNLQAGRAVRLRHRVADLQLAMSAKVDSSEGATHQIAVGKDGSVSAGSLSLRTRAGY